MDHAEVHVSAPLKALLQNTSLILLTPCLGAKGIVLAFLGRPKQMYIH